MATTTVLGATGMTGSQILSTLLALPTSQVTSVTTIARRAPAPSAETDGRSRARLSANVEKDVSKWESFMTANTPQILFSALATTRAAAGGFDKQYLLEHDKNISLAQAARSAATPTTTYVLISSASTNVNSRIPYARMKAEIERDILALDFKHTVILKPGLTGGRREESRPAEAAIRWIADVLGWVSNGLLKDFWTQDADVIGRAAVRAGLRAHRGEMPGNKTILYGRDIMALGKEPLTEEEKQ